MKKRVKHQNHRKAYRSQRQAVDRGSTPKKKKSLNSSTKYKALTVAVFAMLMFYLLGYIIVFMGKPSVPTETVNYGTIDNPQTLKGLIVRDEYVVNSTMDGEISFNYAEDSKVPKGAVVCSVKDKGVTDDIESEIKKIDKDILNAQKTRIDLSKNKEELDKIESEISVSIDNAVYKLTPDSLTDMYSLKNNIEGYLDTRNEILINEITGTTSDLTAQRKEYEQELSENVSSYTADESGILSFMIDGKEAEFTPDNLETITEKQITENVSPQYVSKGLNVKAESPIFKIVKSNLWYIVCYVPNEMSAKWEVGDSLEIYTMYDDEELSTDVTIESISLGENESYVVLSSDENIIDFMPLRTFTFNIRQNAYTGLKIPNTAIIEKTFLKIPLSCIVENLGQSTVILRNGSSDQTVNVSIFTADEQYAYVLQDYDTLKLGDVILMGTGENATEFTISEVENYKCVYVANSSMAEYAVIDIIGQNAEYSIVRPSSSSYGLKVYDSIVSDAKSIENDEVLS